MDNPHISAKVSIVNLRCGEWLSINLNNGKDEQKTAEVRVTPEGTMEVFVEEGIKVTTFKDWYNVD
jgi:hypothetical protein